MKRYILYILVSMALMGVATPVVANANEIEVQEVESVQLFVNGHTLRVVGAEGKHIDIYDAVGNLVYSSDVDVHDKTINIVGRGIFIVKIDQMARKIQVR